MTDADFALLDEVVTRARTTGYQVVIPTDLFRRIQVRVREVEEQRRGN